MDETMETVQGDIESAWSAEDPAGEAEGTEAAAAADQPKGGEETPPAEPKAPDAPVAQPELFTLKNRDETRQVTRDELVAMAQKGWDTTMCGRSETSSGSTDRKRIPPWSW